jgi:hypothetical protein
VVFSYIASLILPLVRRIENTLNPDWCKVIILDYDMGSTTHLAVSIFDKTRSMGGAIFDVAELLGARGNTKAVRLKNGGM